MFLCAFVRETAAMFVAYKKAPSVPIESTDDGCVKVDRDTAREPSDRRVVKSNPRKSNLPLHQLGTNMSATPQLRVPVARTSTAIGTRPTQEDRFLTWQGIHPVQGHISICGIFDGHSGTTCADICRVHMLGYILNHSSLRAQGDPDFEVILKECVRRLEERCLIVTREKRVWDGSTLCVGVIHNGCLWVANVGDSRCVLLREDGVVQISSDHKVSTPSERRRIVSAGAVIKRNRMMGLRKDLEITRALGDREFKDVKMTPTQSGMTLIATPEIYRRVLQTEDEILMLASDGLWDVGFFEMDDIAEMTRRRIREVGVEETVKEVVEEAVRLGGSDNVTLTLVRLGGEAERTEAPDVPKVPRGVITQFFDASEPPLSRGRVAVRSLVKILGLGMRRDA